MQKKPEVFEPGTIEGPSLTQRPWDELALSPIKAMELEAAALPDVVSLAQGIPSFDTPDEIKAFVVEQMRAGACARYSLSPGLPRLREQIAETLKHDGLSYDPDSEILVTCGSIEALSASLLALFEPGAEVLLPSPSYTSYLSALRLARLEPRFVPLDEDRGFDLDPQLLAHKITRRTRAILIAQPNNPTGTIFSASAIRAMLELAEKHGLLVLSDEVYKDFVYVSEPLESPAHWPEFRNRIVRICSFSKAFAMTGWRVGFLHADRKLVSRILRAHDALVTCAPVVSQYAALAALEHGERLVTRFREAFRERRQRMIEHLDSMPAIFDYQTPKASYFAFPRIKDSVPFARDSVRLARLLLHEARVAVVPGVAFGPTGEGHLRLCFARSVEHIDLAFERMNELFSRSYRTRPHHFRRSLALSDRAARTRKSVRVSRRLIELALKLLTKAALRHRPTIVAVAGGRGKTVVKRTLTQYLRLHFDVRSNPLSYNTELGLPLAILGVSTHGVSWPVVGLQCLARAFRPPMCDVLVVEMGAAAPGDMRKLLDIVEPDLAVVMPVANPPAGDPEFVRTLLGEVDELATRLLQRGKKVLAYGGDGALRNLPSLASAEWFGPECLEGEPPTLRVRVGDFTVPVGRDWAGQSELYALVASVRIGQILGMPKDKTVSFLAPVHQSDPA